MGNLIYESILVYPGARIDYFINASGTNDSHMEKQLMTSLHHKKFQVVKT